MRHFLVFFGVIIIAIKILRSRGRFLVLTITSSIRIRFTRRIFRLRLLRISFTLLLRRFRKFCNFFIFTKLINVYSKFTNFLKSFDLFCASNKRKLVIRKRNERGCTNLEVKIDTINKTESAKIFSLNSKEILFVEFTITRSKVFTKTRILTLHQFLDTYILNNVDEVFGTISNFSPVFVRSEQSMSNFMTHEKVIDDARSAVPQRKGKHTSINVEGRCRDVLAVLYNEVLCSKQTGKRPFDFVVTHWTPFFMHVSYKKIRPRVSRSDSSPSVTWCAFLRISYWSS